VAMTWQVSFNNIKSNSWYPLAAQFSSYCIPQSGLILVEFLQARANRLITISRDLINNEIDLDAHWTFWNDFHWSKESHDSQAISIHRLVQDVIMHEFDEEQLLEKWETVLSFLLMFPNTM
jgi:hypothetical protein